MALKPRPALSASLAPSMDEGEQLMQTKLRICQADYSDPAHIQALLALLDGYARDPMGGAEPLSEFAREHLPEALKARPFMFSVLAFDDAQSGLPVGLINCVEGFSTFACQPLVNVHDVVVVASHRGQRVAELMLEKVEALAMARGACKLTLEVLSGNVSAQKLYRRVGFENYQLDPSMGHAQFMQKWL